MRYSFPLSPENSVAVEFTGHPTPEQLRLLQRYVELMVKAIAPDTHSSVPVEAKKLTGDPQLSTQNIDKLYARFDEVVEDPAYSVFAEGEKWGIDGIDEPDKLFDSEEEAQSFADDLSTAYASGVLSLEEQVRAVLKELTSLRSKQ